MSPPRRLAVLCSHLRPDGAEPPAENERPAGQQTVISASPCGDDDRGAAAGRVGDWEAESCVFCRIIRDEAPAFKLYEDDVCVCILDSHPLAPGHSLIIPKRHFSLMEATPPHIIAAMCSKVPFLSNAIMKATDCDAFNLVVNNGEAAGQVIFHTHFHIIPRRSGDKLWPTESFRRSSIEPNETSSLISCIKEQLDSSEG
ncbi:adenylylsulfatase HINT3-like [Triticum dicoccoides]|uniref:adenylylsulfatase HINT3-like n=1 Tax=Triticum dicoccoides TaxID=85692 RepID=UPI0018900333|nr:adenylylsulfatase HINT3-like [Triticum dicoccoides]